MGCRLQEKVISEIKSHRDLTVWQRGMELVRVAYRLTRRLPREETFGLKSQMRRAAVSIPSSIAEGHIQRKRQVFTTHLDIALGSLAELDALYEIRSGEEYLVPANTPASQIEDLRRMLLALQDRVSAHR